MQAQGTTNRLKLTGTEPVEPGLTVCAASCLVIATVFSFQLIEMVQSTGRSLSLQVTVVVEVGKKLAKL